MRLVFKTNDLGLRFMELRGLKYTCFCGRKGWDPTTLVFSCGNWQGDPRQVHPKHLREAPRQSICFDCGLALHPVEGTVKKDFV